MKHYYAYICQGGYIPNDEPARFNTLAELKAYLSSERDYWRNGVGEGEIVRIHTPLRTITAKLLQTSVLPYVYCEFADTGEYLECGYSTD